MAVGDRPIDGNQSPQIPPGDGRLSIRYSAIHLRAPERVQYSYKLEGLDSEWVRALHHAEGHARSQIAFGIKT